MVTKYKLQDDLGRFDTTQQVGDEHVWRVPSMRNVKETAPYFHNGMVPTLEEAVRVCAAGGNNRDLTQGEVKSITAFLGSLSGVLPEQKMPKLP
ncbi:hypothetical protein [Rhodoferax sp.]|uniref:c-type cytochrome n=1 Tax=Rhodoferax sp. TaxID=50421 RepID=UPI00272AD8C4|nr:hypothetical protein [Rhodoferax sp.]